MFIGLVSWRDVAVDRPNEEALPARQLSDLPPALVGKREQQDETENDCEPSEEVETLRHERCEFSSWNLPAPAENRAVAKEPEQTMLDERGENERADAADDRGKRCAAHTTCGIEINSESNGRQ